LALGVEVDAIDRCVTRSDRILQRREAGEGRVAVDVGLRGRLGQRTDDVVWRTDLRIAAAEIDERLSTLGGRNGDARQQRREVLLGESLETLGRFAHPPTLCGGRLCAAKLDRKAEDCVLVNAREGCDLTCAMG